MRYRAFGLLAVTAALGACGSMGNTPFNANQPPATTAAQAVPAGRVALLLPLTGANARLGQDMRQAVQLAMDAPDAPPLDVRDTGGTPAGAATAARDGIAAGDRLIIGPLTAPETAAVRPVSQPAGVGVLAFTSDPAQARPGVWTLGLTPGQQVRRLVGAAREAGKTRYAALLPNGPFGDALAAAYAEALRAAALPPPAIRRYAALPAARDALRDLADDAHRRGDRDAQLKALRDRTDDDAKAQAAQLAAQPVPPPPFDVLLVAETGDKARQLARFLAADDIKPEDVRVLGPALWAGEAGKLPALAGAWYAAPDPALRAAFAGRYGARFGGPPPPLADLAYDAGSLARVLAAGPGYTADALTRPDGFSGTDGVIALMPDGHVRRGLAVFEIGRDGARIVEPSPQTVTAPGS